VGQAIDNDRVAALDRLLALLATSAEATVSGGDPAIRWADEFFPSQEQQFRLIMLKGRLEFGERLPNARVMSALRSAIADAEIPAGVSVGVTGEIALTHEEIEAAMSGVQLAGWVAVLVLFAVLVLGVRSAKIIAATLLMLLVGVVWTSALAMLTVGEYNTLSVVFLVIFFGLGVDFAVHFSLRYQEAINVPGSALLPSLSATTSSVGGALVLCTLTTALGFLSFWPTDYRGLGDLGVIAAGGMLVAAFLTFTLLPACFAVLGRIRPHVVDLPTGDRLVRFLLKHPLLVLSAVALTAVVAGALASRSYFDYSVMALKNPDAESVRELRRLQEQGIATDYAVTLLTREVPPLAKLRALDTVDSVIGPADYLPVRQAEKLVTLEDLQAVLWSAFNPARSAPPPTLDALNLSVAGLRQKIGRLRASAAADNDAELAYLERLDVAMGRLQMLESEAAAVGPGSDADARSPLLNWQAGVVETLSAELAWLRRAVMVGEVTFDDLPKSLQARLLSPEGEQRWTLLPAEDISEVAALGRFVTSVRELVPGASGRPVIEWGVGSIVADSFRQALALAIASILLLLLLNFRNLRDAVLILIPLALAALFTLAAGVVFDEPMNMANVIVLPLIFGLGVDNGIHVVDRFHGAGDVEHLLASSTPRAVVLSTLTTIGTFAALMLSSHQGTASIGMLLTVAVALLLVCTVFVLPVLLSVVVGDRSLDAGGRASQT
jgi:hopanoid biosynthesis associated RND transporter like protein HpnN